MAVSGTVPGKQTRALDPGRFARPVRRITALIAVVGFVWCVMRYGTEWVPAGMDTVPRVPPGSWCIIDRWPVLEPGINVFVDAPSGRVLSKVATVDAEAKTLTVLHPNPSSPWPDSRLFGALPFDNVHGAVLVVFEADGVARGR